VCVGGVVLQDLCTMLFTAVLSQLLSGQLLWSSHIPYPDYSTLRLRTYTCMLYDGHVH